jgi:hypothetical protein
MFDALILALLVVPFGFLAVPWFFRARWGRRGIWLSAAAVIVVLLCLPFVFFEACGACGQGAIAIFMLAPAWMFVGLATLVSAALAAYSLRGIGKR